MIQLVIPEFPYSSIEPFLKTSEDTQNYNCIAWAYGDNSKRYWPAPVNSYYWPSNVPRTEDLASFIKLFSLVNYSICTNGDLEDGYLKIAIFVDSKGKPTHAARQLENGFWTSKLGDYFDVQHSIASMEDGFYGNVKVYMKRPIK